MVSDSLERLLTDNCDESELFVTEMDESLDRELFVTDSDDRLLSDDGELLVSL